MSMLVTSVTVIGLAMGSLAVLILVVAVQRLLRLQWRSIQSHPVGRDDVPPAQRLILDKPSGELAALGFVYLSSGATEKAVVMAPDALAYFDIYKHAESHAYAMVSASPVPEIHQPCMVQLMTCFADGSNWVTLNRARHFSPMKVAQWQVFDDYYPTWNQAWPRHLERMRGAGAEVCTDDDEMLRRLEKSFGDLIPQMVRTGQLQPLRASTHYRLSLLTALHFAVIAIAGQWRASRAVRHLASAPSPDDAGGPLAEADLDAFQAQVAFSKTRTTSTKTKWLVFIVSALLFLAVGGFWLSWSFVPIVLAVVALHEGGHYLAMRLTGYRNVSVFFLPGLGGLAVGEKATATPFEKLFVYLAGPLPGLALAGLAFWASTNGLWTGPAWLNEFLIASLVINFFNLLPIVPLDGGRVLETLAFPHMPRLRFGFAALCCGLLFVLGYFLNDMVLRVVAVLLAFGLPHQWRVMRLDLATPRAKAAVLAEQEAILVLFAAVQTAPFRAWSFAQRSAAVTTLLPEMMGRKAKLWESVAGLTLYAAVLCAPVGVAWVALPQLGFLASLFVPALQVPADDVAPEPERAPGAMPGPEDWAARLAQSGTLPETEQLQALLGAGQAANDSEDIDTASRHFRAAWTLAERLPERDPRRIDTLEGLASVAESDEDRVNFLLRIVSELGNPQGAERLRVAHAKEQLSYAESSPALQLALLRDAVRLRAAVGPAQDADLLSARMLLAVALDQNNEPMAAESELQERIESLRRPDPADRSWEALNRRVQRVSIQVDLAWFLMAHQRYADAKRVVGAALEGLPPKITRSWVSPQQQTLEAAVWVEVLTPASTELGRSWSAYDSSRKQGWGGGHKTLTHEADRAVVAQILQDTNLLAQAQRGIAEVRARLTRSPALCNTPHTTYARWRKPQQEARQRVLQASGACAPGAS